ncbi:MAG: recombinase family protein [bacterium]
MLLTNNKLRVGLYCRVSTTQHQDTDDQEHRLTQWAARAGHTLVGLYRDNGVSGAKAKRPALGEMMSAARDHQIDAVVVTRLSRLCRNTKHLLELVDELEHLGVGLVSIGEQIDTHSPQGRLFVTMLGAVAEFERDLIRERVCDGLAKARRNGKKLGRPRIPESIERRICSMLTSGVAKVVIASETGVHRDTIRRIGRDMRL